MKRFRVTTYFTACIDVDIEADNKEAAIELVRNDSTKQTQDNLRVSLDDIGESWTKHRTAWELPLK